ASRRLREMLPLLGADHTAARRLAKRLRRVTAALGVVRELDVLVQLADDLRRDQRYPSKALERVALSITDARGAARERLSGELPASTLERLAGKLKRAVRAGKTRGENRSEREHGPVRGWVWALEARQARRAAQLRSAIEAAGLLYASQPLH